MANVRLKFIDVSEKSMSIEVGVFRNEEQNEIRICIEDSEYVDGGTAIFLDVSTAIKLHKTLRQKINEAKEVGNE